MSWEGRSLEHPVDMFSTQRVLSRYTPEYKFESDIYLVDES